MFNPGGPGRWLAAPLGGMLRARTDSSGASRVRSVDPKGRDAWTGAPRAACFPPMAWRGQASPREETPKLTPVHLSPLCPRVSSESLCLRCGGTVSSAGPHTHQIPWAAAPAPGPPFPGSPPFGKPGPRLQKPRSGAGRGGGRSGASAHRARRASTSFVPPSPAGRQPGRRRPVAVSGPAGRRPPSSRGPWRTAAAGATLRPFPHFPLWPPDDSRPLQLTGVTCGWHRASQAIRSSPLIARA